MKFTAKDITPIALFTVIFAFLVYSDLGSIEAGFGEGVPNPINFLVLVLFISVVELPIRKNKQLDKKSAEYKLIRKKTNIKLILLVVIFIAGNAVIKSAKDAHYEQRDAEYLNEAEETLEETPVETPAEVPAEAPAENYNQ